MQKLSETAGFIRLMQLSRTHLLPADASQNTPASEAKLRAVVGAPERAKHAGYDEDCGNERAGHGSCRLEENESHGALVAARLGLQRSIGQSLDLELAFVRREFAPPAYTALVHAERSSDGGLGAVVADNVGGLHET